MKYLQDERLSELTQQLTDYPVGLGDQRLLHGRLEAYTMKRGTGDKKAAHALGAKFVAALETSSYSLVPARKRSYSTSEISHPNDGNKRKKRSSSFDLLRDSKVPLRDVSLKPNLLPQLMPSGIGDFNSQTTRRLMTDLILTLNMSFPDYDFADVAPSDFRIISLSSVRKIVNQRLSSVALRKERLLKELWESVNKVINLNDCDVYTYTGDVEWAQALVDEQGTAQRGDLPDRNHNVLWSFNYFFVSRFMKRIVLFTCAESMKNESSEERDEDDYPVAQEDEEEVATEYYIVGEDVTNSELDFDLDPAAAPAGGIPVSPF